MRCESLLSIKVPSLAWTTEKSHVTRDRVTTLTPKAQERRPFRHHALASDTVFDSLDLNLTFIDYILIGDETHRLIP
jgi:hypothetical protein